MIVLKDKSLPSVWQEAEGLMHLDSEGEYYRYERTWHGRRQVFMWVNGIEYDYIPGKHKIMTIYLVTYVFGKIKLPPFRQPKST